MYGECVCVWGVCVYGECGIGSVVWGVCMGSVCRSSIGTCTCEVVSLLGGVVSLEVM